MNITIGYWETRDGCKARVLCTDAPSSHPVVGYIIVYEGSCEPADWTSTGSFSNSDQPSDLIRPWTDRPVIDWSKERDWVKAVAMDKSGRWFRYEKTPELGANVWLPGDIVNRQFHPSEYPQFMGNWKDSLCVRPEVEGGSK